MITRNFKNLVALVLLGNNTGPAAFLQAKTLEGTNIYLGPLFTMFPHNVSKDVGFSVYSKGILLGTGITPPTENDYRMDTLITSGLKAGNVSSVYNVDDNGNPYMVMIFTLSNTTNADIVVSEVGYAQTVCSTRAYGGIASNNNHMVLFDRTLLNTPVTVPANGDAVIEYAIKSIVPE